MVEGTDCYNGDCDWWGGNLEGVGNSPVVLSTPHQLAYSAHDYGPNLYVQNWFNGATTDASLISVWTRFWAYISLNGSLRFGWESLAPPIMPAILKVRPRVHRDNGFRIWSAS